jgi:hypothetical protein
MQFTQYNTLCPVILYFYYSSIIYFVFYNFQQILGRIAHNVPAVYDVFAAAIRERGAFQQSQKCGWRLAWEWSATE